MTLEQQLKQIQQDYERFAKRTIRILVVMALITAIGGGISIYLVDQNSQRVTDIQQSRVDATRQSCISRNVERKVQRDAIDDQIIQTQTIPDKVFKQFGISRDDAIQNLQTRKTKIPKLDCQAAVDKVIASDHSS